MQRNIQRTLDDAIKDICDWNITKEDKKEILAYFKTVFEKEYKKSCERI
jgi:hypothetical protein